MENLLPIVSNDIKFSVIQYIGNREDKQFIKEELRKIKKENPFIAEFILGWARRSKCKAEAAYCGILVYKLLHSQAEADKMEELYE